MDHSKDKNFSIESMDDHAFLNLVKESSFPEFRQKLKENEFNNHNDRMEIIGYMLLKILSKLPIPNDMEVNELKEIKFAFNYNLTKTEVWTLKQYLQGISKEKISKTKGKRVTVDAINQRLRRVYKKLNVNSKADSMLLALKHGLNFWFE